MNKKNLTRSFYGPSESMEFTDGLFFYNSKGDILRDPSEYDPYSEGYTPFGDE